MRTLLGLAVLTSPLWLIVILVPVAIWIAVIAARRIGGPNTGIGVGLVVFAVVVVAPFADEIVGRIYLNHLCATAAGTKVLRTVALPSEYWDAEGNPTFFNKYGNLKRDFWQTWLDEKGGDVRYSVAFAIDKGTSTVRNRRNHKLLAEVTTFRFWGGWIRRNLSPGNTANSCQFIRAPGFSREFYGSIFRQTKSSE